MKTIIEVECVDQDLVIKSKPLIASGGIHENYISFDFCSKWDGFTKTAVFYRDVNKPYHSMIDDSNMCEVPHEVTDDKGTMYFGVFGVSGEVTRTTKMTPYQVKQGARSEECVPSDPTPDVWSQILASFNEVLEEVEQSNQDQRDFISDANKAIDDCEIATNDCYEAIAMLNFSSIDANGGDPTTEDVVEDANDLNGGTPLFN